jgi:hypothetical protein
MRLTQEAARVLVTATDAHERITQEAVRVLVTATDAHERITQLAVRVLIVPAPVATGNAPIILSAM